MACVRAEQRDDRQPGAAAVALQAEEGRLAGGGAPPAAAPPLRPGLPRVPHRPRRRPRALRRAGLRPLPLLPRPPPRPHRPARRGCVGERTEGQRVAHAPRAVARPLRTARSATREARPGAVRVLLLVPLRVLRRIAEKTVALKGEKGVHQFCHFHDSDPRGRLSSST